MINLTQYSNEIILVCNLIIFFLGTRMLFMLHKLK